MSGATVSIPDEVLASVRSEITTILAGPGRNLMAELMKLITRLIREAAANGYTAGLNEGRGQSARDDAAHRERLYEAYDADLEAQRILRRIDGDPLRPAADHIAFLRECLIQATLAQRFVDISILEDEAELRARIAQQCQDFTSAASASISVIKVLRQRIVEGLVPARLRPVPPFSRPMSAADKRAR